MFFSSEPKINRIAKHLHLELQSYYQTSRAYNLTVISETYDAYGHTFISDKARDLKNASIMEKINTPSWCREKEDFSWWISPSWAREYDPRHNPELVTRTAEDMYTYFKDLLNTADAIVSELNAASPNYKNIIDLAKLIKNKTTAELDTQTEKNVFKLIATSYPDGNLQLDFLKGIFGLIYATALCLTSLLFIPFYLDGSSKYCGGPTFFLDTAQYFCDSLCNIITPIAMLRSKYETDSYDVRKGKLLRSLDGLISLAEESQQAEKTNSPGVINPVNS